MSRGEIRGRESGQALILIVLAVVGLLGLTALAVDGANAFAQRRQAQNAADTSAFAAAIGRIQNYVSGDDFNAGTLSAVNSAALARAASNTFGDTNNDAGVNAGSPIDVIVVYPPDSTAPAAYVGSHDYVQVKINANIQTFFARIVGVGTLPIHVQAIARAKPPYTAPLGGDNGIVALGDVCNAIRFHGNGSTRLIGGGVFSNSTANGSHANCWSIGLMGTADQLETPSAQVVGCSHGIDPGDISSGKLVFTSGGSEAPCSAPIPWPPPPPDIGVDCATLPAGTRTGHTAHPGQWSGTFPPGSVDTLDPGVYCINGDFRLNGGDSLTSNGGVTFILYGDLTWNGNADINLTPTATGKLAGLLIYRPLNDPMCGTPPCQTLDINGGANSLWSGTIFAPDSLCKITGTSDTFNPQAQAICYTVDVGGNSTWHLNYNGANNWDFPYPGQTGLSR
jgi:hypothetical protein